MTACGLAVCWNVFRNVRCENLARGVSVDGEQLIKFGSHRHFFKVPPQLLLSDGVA